MTTTLRLAHGMAVSPQKDLELFRTMAARGKHLSSFAAVRHSWEFTDGDPIDAVFDVAYQDHADDDYFAMFRAAGWTPVLNVGNMHIFRAAPGTAPVHTDTGSAREELERNRNRAGVGALVSIVVLALATIVLGLVDAPTTIRVVVTAVLLVPVVYTTIPFFGSAAKLRKLPPTR